VALAMPVEQIGPCPNRKGEPASIDIDCVAVDRSLVIEWFDRNQVTHPSARRNAVAATLSEFTGAEIFKSIGKVDLLLASPECTHHSVARGGMSP
jgi:site-specific DNA-cytosine methylase